MWHRYSSPARGAEPRNYTGVLSNFRSTVSRYAQDAGHVAAETGCSVLGRSVATLLVGIHTRTATKTLFLEHAQAALHGFMQR
jgi:hypothetical protein